MSNAFAIPKESKILKGIKQAKPTTDTSRKLIPNFPPIWNSKQCREFNEQIWKKKKSSI